MDDDDDGPKVGGYGRNRKRRAGKLTVRDLGPIHAGASDAKGHRTTISMPQELADLVYRICAGAKGSVYDSPQGLMRDAVHARVDDLMDAGLLDLENMPELKRAIQVDRMRARQEQTIHDMKGEQAMVDQTVAAMSGLYNAGNAEGLRRTLDVAVESFGLLSPSTRRQLEGHVADYRGKMEGMRD